MQEKTCAVVGAGDFFETTSDFEKTDVVIAADGGYESLKRIHVQPDLLVGDFDSLTVPPSIENVLRLPKEKDDTDMLACVKEGMKQGCRFFYLYGGTGGRFDHTIANVQLLSFLAKQGCQGILVSEKTYSTVIVDGSIRIQKNKDGYVSVFCLSDKSTGVTLNGLKYPLTEADLTNDFPLGVSNEFVENEAVITVENGMLMIVWPR